MKSTMALFVSGICCGMAIMFLILDCQQPEQAPTAIETVYDTVVALRQSKPIVITKCKTKTIHTSDTLYRTPPFTAIVDTIIVHDTLRAEFQFPANTLSLELRRMPDTTLVERACTTKTITEKQPWWRAPLYFLTGALAGYYLGNIK